MILRNYLRLAMAIAISVIFLSCNNNKRDANDDSSLTAITENNAKRANELIQPNPELTGEQNAVLPNCQYEIEQDKEKYPGLRIDMTGVQDKNTSDWVDLYGSGDPNQNLWVEIDGVPKYVKALNSDSLNSIGGVHFMPVDIVFLVDNSTSMYEEADAIARDIRGWAKELANNGLDAKFATVGYDGAITGAIDLTTVDNLSQWLSKGTGIDRTRGFSGPNAQSLRGKASAYATGGGDLNECAMAALRFADQNFTFTPGAPRVYVNFTDENNQPAGRSAFSVESLKTDWDASRGSIHTVFSDDKQLDRDESNSKMSDLTGGTVMYTNNAFRGVTLSNLPVTLALRNSHVLNIRDIHDYIDGKEHDVKITVKTPDGKVQGERIYKMLLPPR